MLHNEPVDILAIASARFNYASNLLRGAMVVNYSATSQEWFDRALADFSIASDDMNAVQTLIRELARS